MHVIGRGGGARSSAATTPAAIGTILLLVASAELAVERSPICPCGVARL